LGEKMRYIMRIHQKLQLNQASVHNCDMLRAAQGMMYCVRRCMRGIQKVRAVYCFSLFYKRKANTRTNVLSFFDIFPYVIHTHLSLWSTSFLMPFVKNGFGLHSKPCYAPCPCHDAK
jgi:hypothetical protein